MKQANILRKRKHSAIVFLIFLSSAHTYKQHIQKNKYRKRDIARETNNVY